MNINLLSLLLLMGIASCQSQKVLTPEQKTIIQQTKTNFVFVDGGTFVMGDDGEQLTNKHKVTLDSYSISKYETTWREYDNYTSIENMNIKESRFRKLAYFGQNHAARNISWFEAKAYCQWLGKQLGLPIDLATEAQWEYAARSRGMDVEHATNNGKIGEYEEGKYNYGSNKNEIGHYPPNPLGIYDMSGGRPEWVLDYPGYYPIEHVTNPLIDEPNRFSVVPKRMVRGYHTLSRSVYKRNGAREEKDVVTGITIRCVCNQQTPIE